MRRLIGIGLAAALAACGGGDATTEHEDQPSWSTAETNVTGAPTVNIGSDPVAPVVRTGPHGHWVRDIDGECGDREDWFIFSAGGQLDRVLAQRSTCGTSGLERYAGRWSTDRQVASMRWANRAETVQREVSYWADGATLHLGAYIPVDGGWHMRDATRREIGGHSLSESFEVGLRIASLELVDGAACELSATVYVEKDGEFGTTEFDLPCHVEAEGDGFVIGADGFGLRPDWLAHLEDLRVFDELGYTLGELLYEKFQPRMFTLDGRTLWPADQDTSYRHTVDSPPNSASDLDG